MKKFLIFLFLFSFWSCDNNNSSSPSNNQNNNNAVCGNGILESGEECDSTDLNGKQCEDVGDFTSGTLSCTDSCIFDTTSCTKTDAVCGNGILESGEECDSTDLDGKRCSDLEGFVSGVLSCTDSCTFDTSACSSQECVADNFQECDVLQENQCCPHNGMESVCLNISEDAGSICFQTCNTGEDCGYSMVCNAQIGDKCFIRFCGEGAESTPINHPCQLDAERDGICVPNGTATDDSGICLENGEAENGEPCRKDPETNNLGKILTPEERALTCNGGICVAVDAQGNPTEDGTCIDVCDPVEVYENTTYDATSGQWISGDTCPDGFNCMNLSQIDTNETADASQPNPNYLFRTADFGLCYPQHTGVLQGPGAVTCDLMTSLSMKDGTPCGKTSLEVMGFPVTDVDTTCQVMADGGLIGVCTYAESPDNRKSLGETCDPEHKIMFGLVPASECEEGTVCTYADPLHEDLTSASYACMKPCNATLGETDNPACAGLVDSDSNPYICLTTSKLRTADHELPTRTNSQTGQTETESSPSPLGYCIPPQ